MWRDEILKHYVVASARHLEAYHNIATGNDNKKNYTNIRPIFEILATLPFFKSDISAPNVYTLTQVNELIAMRLISSNITSTIANTTDKSTPYINNYISNLLQQNT